MPFEQIWKQVACLLSTVRIDGWNGSNACAIISALVMWNILQAAISDGSIDVDVEHTYEEMQEGPLVLWHVGFE